MILEGENQDCLGKRHCVQYSYTQKVAATLDPGGIWLVAQAIEINAHTLDTRRDSVGPLPGHRNAEGPNEKPTPPGSGQQKTQEAKQRWTSWHQHVRNSVAEIRAIKRAAGVLVQGEGRGLNTESEVVTLAYVAICDGTQSK